MKLPTIGTRFETKNYNLLEVNINMKRIKFAGDTRKKTFRNSMLYETFDVAADSVKLVLSLFPICIL